nr:unnamed protein product [Callosobruchus chinensis]
MNNVALPRSQPFQLLGVSITENMIWHEHVSSIATAAAKKLGYLFRARKYFSASNLLTLYKAQLYAAAAAHLAPRPPWAPLLQFPGAAQLLGMHGAFSPLNRPRYPHSIGPGMRAPPGPPSEDSGSETHGKAPERVRDKDGGCATAQILNEIVIEAYRSKFVLEDPKTVCLRYSNDSFFACHRVHRPEVSEDLFLKREIGYCTLSNKRCPNEHSVLMNNLALLILFKLLEVNIIENMIWHEYVLSITTAAEKKIGYLFRARKYFSPSSLFTLYKAQIKLSLEY